jgi:excisionase family DNA binding protein
MRWALHSDKSRKAASFPLSAPFGDACHRWLSPEAVTFMPERQVAWKPTIVFSNQLVSHIKDFSPANWRTSKVVTPREEPLLDIEQAAQFLQVSETSLRRWTNSGRLACLRVGGKRERRFRLSDLLAFMENQPADVASQLAPGTHLCGFYSTNEGRAKLAATFLADGIAPGAVSYLVADRAVRREVLAQLGMDTAALQREIAAGRLVLCDHAATGLAQMKNFEERFAAATAGGAHSLRVVGDVWGVARKITRDELVEFEQAYDQASRRLPLISLCLYDVRQFSSLDTLHALRGHGDGFRYPAERWLD